MNGPFQKPHPAFACYKDAQARLAELREVAVKGFEAAQDSGDVAAAEHFKEVLQRGLDAFKCFRGELPTEVLASINADRILETFSIDRDNFVNLVIPADVGDEEAMRALNVRYRELFPRRYGAAIGWPEIDHILEAGGGIGRRNRGPWVVRLMGVVPNTIAMTRDQQAEALCEKGLAFPHPIEQALAAAAYACMRGGADLFESLYVRSSVPGFSLFTDEFNGVLVSKSRGFDAHHLYAASGSPVPVTRK